MGRASEDLKLAGTDAVERFAVVNTKTGQTVGEASSLSRARRILDKRDNEYGGYIHKVVPVKKPSAPQG